MPERVHSEGAVGSRVTRGIETGIRMLEFLAGWTDPETLPRPRAAALHEIATALGIPEPTGYRILKGLVCGGWVEKTGLEYRLAFRLALVGVGIHEALRRQAESCAAMVRILDERRAVPAVTAADPGEIDHVPAA